MKKLMESTLFWVALALFVWAGVSIGIYYLMRGS